MKWAWDCAPREGASPAWAETQAFANQRRALGLRSGVLYDRVAPDPAQCARGHAQVMHFRHDQPIWCKHLSDDSPISMRKLKPASIEAETSASRFL